MIKGESFYKFSCGNYLKREAIADDSSTISSFDKLEENLNNALLGLRSFILKKE